MLVTTAPFFVLGFIARARHGSRVSDGPGQLGLPPTDYTGHNGLVEFHVALVVTAGLRVEHGGLTTNVVIERMREIAGRVVDVDILSGRNERCRPPSLGSEILGDGGGETAGVGENGDRSPEQHLLRTVATKRTADSHAVPGIRNAKTVRAEYVDAIGLAKRPNLACVVHGDLFRDHDDLLEIWIHADEFGDAIADA
jgi:hypothetical protein